MTAEGAVRPPALWLLALLTFSGTVAMHMFIPALSDAAQDLGASPAAMQATISLYILGLAVGQLAWGPLSDRFGRRPALLIGLSLFTVAGIVCALATSLTVLVPARFVQALGGSAGMLLGRTIVGDTSVGEQTVRRLSALQLIIMAGPALSPMLGALVVTFLRWRWVFALFVLLGIAALACTAWKLPETRRTRGPGHPRELTAGYARLLRSAAFVGWAVGGACATASFYAFISAAPFLFVGRFGTPVAVVGLVLFLLCAGIGLGSLLAARAAGWSKGRVWRVGNGLQLGCAALLVGQLLLLPTVPGAVATMFFYCVGQGLCGPTALAGAMAVRPEMAGAASGVYGAGQMAVGALCTAAVAFGSDVGTAAATVLLAASVVAHLGFRLSETAERSTRAGGE